MLQLGIRYRHYNFVLGIGVTSYGTSCALKWNKAAILITYFLILANRTRDSVACALANITKRIDQPLTICLPSILAPPFAHRWCYNEDCCASSNTDHNGKVSVVSDGGTFRV